MFWGFSEATDLQEEFFKAMQNENSPGELNILLYGDSDPRHFLKTVAKRYKHDDRKLNFYFLDGCIEIIARNLLLVSVALENPELFSIKSKMMLFMDIYGNSLLRPNSCNYVASKAKVLTRMITEPDVLEKLAPMIRIDALKYRERDGLEETFKFWQPRETHVFNINKYWDDRNRHLLGSRYDHRDGAFDWDLQMRLKEVASQICPQEYKHWRETGIAFTFPEFEQTVANKTLVAGLARDGVSYKHRGYLGDITVGPFSAFGLQCSDPKMLKSNRGVNDYRSTDITERNLLEIFSEIQEGKSYVHNEENSHKYGNVCLRLDRDGVWDLGLTSTQDSFLEYEKEFLKLPNVTINFLSVEDILKISNDQRFERFFHVVFVANNYLSFLKSEFANILNEKCLILFETKTISVLRKEEVNEFLAKIQDFARSINLEAVTNFNVNLKYSIVKYKCS